MEPTQTNTPAPAPVTPETPKAKTSYGTLLGLLVIVAIIVIGALYFLNERVSDSSGTSLQEQSTSTEPDAIQADLEAGSPDEFEKDLDKAFVELDAAFESAP